MTWKQRYQLRRHMHRSLWLLPAVAVVLAFLVSRLARWIDRITGWGWLNLSDEGARSILGAFTASMLTFIVFIVSSMLIVVQLASAQLTPRVISLAFTGVRIKVLLAVFTLTYTYTIAAAGRIDDSDPSQLSIALAIALNLASILQFFWFAEELGAWLRPISILTNVAARGLDVIRYVYPQEFDAVEHPTQATPPAELREITHTGSSGVFLAFSQADLLALARQADATIEIVPQVGEFLSKGDALFRIIVGHRPIDDDSLRDCIAVGPERTMEQDPMFALRIIVDVANKALSPAINDPTTAVLAIDQLHRLLLSLGKRRLDSGEVLDADGRLRLAYRTPDWEDFVSLAATEIRHYGGGSLQVARRLRAMLEHLLRVLPEARHAAIQQELDLLQSATQRLFHERRDRASATVGDMQGIGGSTSAESSVQTADV
jgi:uncharacterized membrane protein